MHLNSLRGLSLKAKAVLVALTLLPLYYISYQTHPATTTTLTPDDFADQWLSTDLLQPFDLSPIRTYCAGSTWRPNLVFNAPGINGGIGNVRAAVLDFLFFAIEAGAAIVLPQMVVRSTDDLFDVWSGTHANFSRMFDEAHFLREMARACPQMRIHRPGKGTAGMTILPEPYVPASRRQDLYPGNTRATWLEQTNGWLREHNVMDNTLTMVNVDRTMWEVDTRSLPPAFRINFPMVLRINPDIRRYAGVAMANMASQHGVSMVPSDELHFGAFYGAHLRTEADTVSAGWFAPPSATEVGVNFTAQTDAYLAHAAKNRLKTMYVATGNASELSRFAAKANASTPRVEITSKWSLLSASDAEALATFEWDQQALVDYEILRRCSAFGGFAKSSFAFAIAVARNAWMEGQGRPLGHSWRMKELDDHVAFDDGLSRILGRNELNERKCPRGCWP